MRRVLAVAALVLAGCAAPPPAVQYQVLKPELPPSLLRQAPAPAVPECTTQACVADYIVDLHAWAIMGWAQVAAISAALAAAPEASK